MCFGLRAEACEGRSSLINIKGFSALTSHEKNLENFVKSTGSRAQPQIWTRASPRGAHEVSVHPESEAAGVHTSIAVRPLWGHSPAVNHGPLW